MKTRVSDYIAEFIAAHGIHHVFSVVGGGAMFLNNSLGHHPGLKTVYNHHEQACSIAAEAYYRVHNRLACVCVTSGPGAINALNGVVGAYQDSIPMLVLSGQTKTSLMTVNSGLNLRTLGNQEFDIMSTLSKATKYARTVMKAEEVRYCLEKALYLATEGRPGPCWLEVPVDIQSALVETDSLKGYEPALPEEYPLLAAVDNGEVLHRKLEQLVAELGKAQRPVIYAGNGIRLSGGCGLFSTLVDSLRIPVVTCWDSIDLIDTASEFYVGRAGTMGDRAGNFAVQNSDLVLAIGTRLNVYQVGYQIEAWAREAKIVVVDVDRLELEKKTIRVDLPICADASVFMEKLLTMVGGQSLRSEEASAAWQSRCLGWKQKYPVVLPRHYSQAKEADSAPAQSVGLMGEDARPDATHLVNVYALVDTLSRSLPEGAITVVANGSASVVGSAAYYIRKGQRFIMNCGLSSMGYDLPAAVGVAVELSSPTETEQYAKSVWCLAGDGSIMMNLQELQTIVTNKLPVKLVIINNNGYQQIRLTQTNMFNRNFVGLGPDSHDLSFPDFEKLITAFGMPYRVCKHNSELKDSITWLNDQHSYAVLEVICTTDQAFEPKSSSKRLEDGSIVSAPLEDLAPFLPREELKENMIVKMWHE